MPVPLRLAWRRLSQNDLDNLVLIFFTATIYTFGQVGGGKTSASE